MSFTLHPTLAKDCRAVGDLPLCRVLLMDNANFPWLVLVPRREKLRELFDLTAADHAAAMQEVRQVAEALAKLTGADKMNVAALGNQVEQLHIHIIARFKSDAAWPNPVWNANVKPTSYSDTEAAAMLRKIRDSLGL